MANSLLVLRKAKKYFLDKPDIHTTWQSYLLLNLNPLQCSPENTPVIVPDGVNKPLQK